MSSSDRADRLNLGRIDDPERHPVGRAMLADRVVMERGRAGTSVDDATSDVELIGRPLVRAARGNPPTGANQLTHFDAFLARPRERSPRPLWRRFAARDPNNHDFRTPFQVRRDYGIA